MKKKPEIINHGDGTGQVIFDIQEITKLIAIESQANGNLNMTYENIKSVFHELRKAAAIIMKDKNIREFYDSYFELRFTVEENAVIAPDGTINPDDIAITFPEIAIKEAKDRIKKKLPNAEDAN